LNTAALVMHAVHVQLGVMLVSYCAAIKQGKVMTPCPREWARDKALWG
jgi:hypothetical protein